MNGRRTAKRTRAGLALAVLLLLPGCYARQPIASDPPAEPAGTPVAAKKPAPVAVAAKPEPVAAEPAKPDPAAAAPESAKTEPAKPEPAAEPAAQPAQQNAAAAAPAQPAVQEYYVQTGSFTTEKNAEGAVAWLKERGYAEVRIVRVEQGQTTYLRVQAGPFQGYAPARKALDELKKDWPQAFIPGD